MRLSPCFISHFIWRKEGARSAIVVFKTHENIKPSHYGHAKTPLCSMAPALKQCHAPRLSLIDVCRKPLSPKQNCSAAQFRSGWWEWRGRGGEVSEEGGNVERSWRGGGNCLKANWLREWEVRVWGGRRGESVEGGKEASLFQRGVMLLRAMQWSDFLLCLLFCADGACLLFAKVILDWIEQFHLFVEFICASALNFAY